MVTITIVVVMTIVVLITIVDEVTRETKEPFIKRTRDKTNEDIVANNNLVQYPRNKGMRIMCGTQIVQKKIYIYIF
jgi:hypothetical protein